MSILPAGGSVARRAIARYGDTITLTTETRSVDLDTDWNDEAITTESTEVKAIVNRVQQETRIDADETGSDATFRYFFTVRSEVEDDITIHDATDDQPATTATYQGRDFGVVKADRSVTGIIRLECGR